MESLKTTFDEPGKGYQTSDIQEPGMLSNDDVATRQDPICSSKITKEYGEQAIKSWKQNESRESDNGEVLKILGDLAGEAIS